MLTVAASFWEDFEDPLKVTFDPELRYIYLNPQYSEFDVKIDIYSASKRWLQRRQNAGYPPPLRTIGGDPVGGGQYAGDIYFLINNWRIVVSTAVNLNGILYNDAVGVSPFIIQPGAGVTAKVSNLAYAYSTTGVSVPTVVEIRQEMDSNSVKLGSIKTKVDSLVNGPTAAAIADAVRAELTPELAHIMTIENTGLTSSQATMLLEMYELLGLDPTKPLIVTQSSRVAGDISQSIITSNTETIVSRV